MSRCKKDLVEVPLQELSVWPVEVPERHRYRSPRSLVKLLTVVKLPTEPWTDQETVLGIDTKVPAVEKLMHIGAQ